MWIDGIAQIESPFSSQKPPSFQAPPVTPNFDKETYEAIKYEGLPPLGLQASQSEVIIFTNVTHLYVSNAGSIHEVFSNANFASPHTVVVEKGVIVCDGSETSCQVRHEVAGAQWIDLEGGSLS